jgi:amino acid transporter
MGTAAGLGVLAVFTLLGILATKELARGHDSPRVKILHDILNIAIVPLVLAFLIVVVVQIVRALL